MLCQHTLCNGIRRIARLICTGKSASTTGPFFGGEEIEREDLAALSGLQRESGRLRADRERGGPAGTAKRAATRDSASGVPRRRIIRTFLQRLPWRIVAATHECACAAFAARRSRHGLLARFPNNGPMEPVIRPAAVSMRVVWIVTFVLVVVVAGFIAAGATMVLSLLHMLDRSDAHVCGIAAVRRAPSPPHC